MIRFTAFVFVSILLVSFPLLCRADPPLSGQPDDSSVQSVENEPAQNEKVSYQEWLETYKAWDKLDEVYAEGEQTAENVMRQAAVALQAGDPRRVLDIVQSVGQFVDDNATEADRLWIGAQAFRALGDPEQAVFWYLRSVELLTSDRAKQRLQDEPGLALVWKDVFRKLFQVYVGNIDLTREAQGVYLDRLLVQAVQTWSADIFWVNAERVFGQAQLRGDRIIVEHSGTDERLYSGYVYYTERMRIARALAASALGYAEGSAPLIELSDQYLGAFWRALYLSIGNDDRLVAHCGDEASEAPLAETFPRSRARRYFVQHCRSLAVGLRENWRYAPDSQNYEHFLRNSRLLSMEEMHELFQKGRAPSLMVGDVSESDLIPLRLGLAIAVDDRDTAARLWDLVDAVTLPNGLKLAGMLYFDKDFSDVFRRAPNLGNEKDKEWMTLLEAGGRVPPLPHRIPFWQRVDPALDRSTLIRNWPLDMDVMLEVWKYDWSIEKQPNLARRVVYLYPNDQFGMLCSLYLAQQALDDKQLGLGQYYLDIVDPAATNSTLTAEYHRVDAELHILHEDMDGAYQAYQRLVATGAPIEDTTRLKIAFLLQQRGELQAGREHLLRLWNRKDEFKTSMQAEILFYLAEGEQAMGLSDQALDYYLHLAWEYPQESMWALTAMYRASNIYESRKQYEPAARLLKTVIKNAETAKQRETAKTRLDNIQAKQARDSGYGTGSVQYPF